MEQELINATLRHLDNVGKLITKPMKDGDKEIQKIHNENIRIYNAFWRMKKETKK